MWGVGQGDMGIRGWGDMIWGRGVKMGGYGYIGTGDNGFWGEG